MLQPFAKLVLLLVKDEVLEDPIKSSFLPYFPICAEFREGLLSYATLIIGLDFVLFVDVNECLC